MKFLDQVYFNNSVRSYIIVCITILIAFVLKRIISKYATSLLFKLFKRKSDKLDKIEFDSLIVAPVERILFVLISIFSIDRLNFPQALTFTIHKVTSQEIVESLASAIIIICFVSLV